MRRLAIKGGLIVAIVFAAWQFGQAQAQLADFKITLEASAGGAKLECSQGCAWTKLLQL